MENVALDRNALEMSQKIVKTENAQFLALKETIHVKMMRFANLQNAYGKMNVVCGPNI